MARMPRWMETRAVARSQAKKMQKIGARPQPGKGVNRGLTPICLTPILLLLAACASPPANAPEARGGTGQLLLLNRVTWGANTAAARALAQRGSGRWLEAQLRPPEADALPP